MCGKTEDADHFLLECERYSKLRFDLLMDLNCICDTEKTSLREFSWITILGQEPDNTRSKNKKILGCVIKFIDKTQRFKS